MFAWAGRALPSDSLPSSVLCFRAPGLQWPVGCSSPPQGGPSAVLSASCSVPGLPSAHTSRAVAQGEAWSFCAAVEAMFCCRVKSLGFRVILALVLL